MKIEGDVLTSGIAIIALVWYIAIWAICLTGCLTARRFRLRPRSPLSSSDPASVEGVSILRPVKGLDQNLFETLESTFTQEYPKYEVIFSVADNADQALPVIRDVIAKHPAVAATIIIGDEVVGPNPKVNNLIRPFKQAKYDILWVLDSNVLVSSGTLARAVDALLGLTSSNKTQRIGLVHHVPFAMVSEPAIGSRLEEAFLNTTHAKMYIAINRLAIDSCVTGKSNIYRLSDVQRVNGDLVPLANGAAIPPGRLYGLAAFGRFLAEDNMIASAIWHELGLKHDLSCDVANNILGRMTLLDYVSRRVRWIRVRKHMSAAATLVEPFTESLLLSFLAAWACNHFFNVPPVIFFVFHYLAWILLDLDIYASLAGQPISSTRIWSFLAGWLGRECLALPIWIIAMMGNEVVWRGRKYRVLRHGCVEAVTTPSTGSRSWFSRIFYWRRDHTDYYQPVNQEPEIGRTSYYSHRILLTLANRVISRRR